jgi:galactose mutarotase-like enzyme
MDRHAIAADGISADIKADGAELCSLRDAAGRELLWQALPAWPRHAPVLFPIVGRLVGDTLRHGGKTYKLTQHGFARDRSFLWEERTPTSCRLSLIDDADTRARYPFAFRFQVAYGLSGAALTVTFTIINTGDTMLPASMGAHPAFRWPLADGVPKDAHTLIFSNPEPAPVRRVSGGLLLPQTFPTPIQGNVLKLQESLFAADALILDHPASQSVRFAAPGVAGLEVAWEGFSQLGVWMKPGADFLCIEPWRGYASPTDFDGAFSDKPGLLHIPPGERRTAMYRVRVGA